MIKDVTLLTIQQVQDLARKLGHEITDRVSEKEDVIFVGILKGCLFLLSDVLRSVGFECDYALISASSYQGVTSTSVVEVDIRALKRLEGRTVILVDEICDTGMTLSAVKERMLSLGAARVLTCVLLNKPSRRVVDLKLDFVGKDIEDHFVIGYGLDLDNKQRCLPYIYYRTNIFTNREAHEEAAGMNLDMKFFNNNNIDPDAEYVPPVVEPAQVI